MNRSSDDRRLGPAGFVVLVGLALFLMSAAFVGGLFAAPYVRAQVPAAPTPPANVRDQFEVFWQAWSIVEQNYVRKVAIDPKKMTYGAIRGMLASLDDEGHTRFLSPTDVKLEDSSLRGRFEGIGAEVAIRDGKPMIVAPLEGSPAERAGLKAGDVILRINDEDVSDLTLTQLVTRVRGPRGTSVEMTIQRTGERTPLKLTVVRDVIRVNAVSWAMLPATAYAHIRVTQFTHTVDSELERALREARAAGAEGLIVDLRNNPGGLLHQAVEVTSEFLTEGNVLLQEDREGNRQPFPVKPGGLATDLPMIVLVNEGSASASEIFAGAIQDHRRGTVVGQKTFGTGTVLSTFQLKDGSAILLGTGQWLTPSGRVIWKQGIRPDVVVALPPEAEMVSPRRVQNMTSAEVRASGDEQLLAAIEVLAAQRGAPVGGGVGAGRSTLQPVPAY